MTALVLISLLTAIAFFVFSYNSLTFKKNAVEQNYGAIQSYIKKRADLIPNLVAVVRSYAEHEKELLNRIAEVRSILDDDKLSETRRLESSELMSQLILQVFARSESYPELKSNENFKHLQTAISEIEEQLSAARRAYSSAVTFYNNGVEMIPFNIVATMMGLKTKSVYTAQQADRE